MLIACLFGRLALAEANAPLDDQTYRCSGNPGAESCVCAAPAACKAMLDRCKNASMNCIGPVCTCDMARKRPGLTVGGKPKPGGAMQRPVTE
ncbi:hypothetical protein G3572_02215 [Rhodobacter sp. ETT8]|uniref:Uncharacterized protein n=2 Tax=Pseudotabrizicola algicola TaxID=2709381 RepID=A0A6B3RIR4_9RHOB|nr:hypothetical protein [Pseudotabrizicola algicola]